MCSDLEEENIELSISLTKILTFHKLIPEFSFGSTNFSPRRFEKLLIFLQNKNYDFVSLEQAVTTPSEKSLLFTFDDGYLHLIKYLPQFIEKYKIKPLIFIPTHYIGLNNEWDYSYLFQKSPHLDKNSIKQLSHLGVDFGSHGHTHKALTKLSDDALQSELIKSKNILEDITGKEITTISYPFGRYNRKVLDVVKKTGYKYGVTMNFPLTGDKHYTLGRYAIYGYDNMFTINQKISRGKLYLLEKYKSKVTNKLAVGTILLNSIGARKKINSE